MSEATLLDIIAHLSTLIYMCILFQYSGGGVSVMRTVLGVSGGGEVMENWLQQDSFKPETN